MKKFITLTFKENVNDFDYANYEFKKFVQRLSWYVGFKVKYLNVIEFQRRGAIHYHGLFNTPFIKNSKLSELWSNGFVRINNIDNVSNLGSYVCKYLGKEPNLKRGKKKFFHSRNLQKPHETITPWYTELLHETQVNENAKLLYEKTFDSEYRGEINYRQYFLINKS